ncbi:cupredoxin domain-containing protein [Bradyrhizobium oligotrophicum S58]
MKTSTAIGAALATALIIAVPADAHEAHGSRGYSAGEPGDPKQPSRTIEVLLSEMEFTPARIEVKRGEQIRFVLRNTGKEDHEFLLATKAENLKHAAVMKKHPHMEHDEPNGTRLAPNKTAELLWRFTKPGTFEYSCLIPDHRDYGMTGHVAVK